jgi:hypothetical protein
MISFAYADSQKWNPLNKADHLTRSLGGSRESGKKDHSLKSCGLNHMANPGRISFAQQKKKE